MDDVGVLSCYACRKYLCGEIGRDLVRNRRSAGFFYWLDSRLYAAAVDREEH